MGYYIDQTPYGAAPLTGKADWLLAHIPGARELRPVPTSSHEWQKNLVCVVENGPFDAAGVVFDPNEMHAFLYSDPRRPDLRRKRWLIIPNAFRLATHGWGSVKFCPSCDGRLRVTDAAPLADTEHACECAYRPEVET